MPLPVALAALGTKAGITGLLSSIGSKLFATKMTTAATTYVGTKLLGL